MLCVAGFTTQTSVPRTQTTPPIFQRVIAPPCHRKYPMHLIYCSPQGVGIATTGAKDERNLLKRRRFDDETPKTTACDISNVIRQS